MLKALLIAIAIAAGGGRAALPARCGPTCAAYRVIAEALPADRSGTLARAIVATPGFDYARLARSLRIPTTTDIRRGWPAFCRSRFPRGRDAAERCDGLLFQPDASATA
jgi:hypothetical protein